MVPEESGADVERQVPDELSRLWRLPGAGRTGRPAELDVERVVRAAVALADEAGLQAATLPKVAESLGYSTMSLYRHVGSKDELLTLMLDAGVASPPDIRTGPAHWRDGLREWTYALRDVYVERHWLIDVPVSGPPSGPNQIAWFDAGLKVLRAARLASNAKIAVLALLSGYVRQMVTLAAEHNPGLGPDPARTYRTYAANLARLVDRDRFPYAAMLFAGNAFEAPEYGTEPITEFHFDFGLNTILRGIAED